MYNKKFLLLLAVLCYHTTVQASENQQQVNKLSAEDRFERNRLKLQQESDPEVLVKAAQDLVNFVHLSPTPEELINSLDQQISNLIGKNMKIYQDLALVKANILARIGRWNEAKTLFETAIQEKWPQSLQSYLDCMTATGRNRERAIEEFNRCVDTPSYLDYRGRREDLSVFMTILLFARKDNPDFRAVQNVFPNLIFNDKNPYLLELSHAICLITDENYEEGIARFLSIESVLREANTGDPVYKDIPLFIAWALFNEGKNYDQAREWLRIFQERNQEDLGHVLGRILRIAYYFERYADLRHKIVEVTSFLLDNPMFTNSDIRSKLNAEVQTNPLMKTKMPADLYAHVLELHAHSLSWKFDWPNAVKIWDEIIKDYYPHTITGASAMMSKIVYLASSNNVEGGDIGGALELLDHLLENAPYDEIIFHALRLKVKYKGMSGEYKEALSILQQLYDWIPPNPTPEQKECLEKAKRMEENIYKSMEYQRMADENRIRRERFRNMTREERMKEALEAARKRKSGGFQ